MKRYMYHTSFNVQTFKFKLQALFLMSEYFFIFFNQSINQVIN